MVLWPGKMTAPMKIVPKPFDYRNHEEVFGVHGNRGKSDDERHLVLKFSWSCKIGVYGISHFY